MILVCIFISPLYFLIRKKWAALAINAALYGLACLLVLSIILIWAGPVFWFLSVLHATWYYREERTARHAEMLATKMAEKMQGAKQPPSAVPPKV